MSGTGPDTPEEGSAELAEFPDEFSGSRSAESRATSELQLKSAGPRLISVCRGVRGRLEKVTRSSARDRRDPPVRPRPRPRAVRRVRVLRRRRMPARLVPVPCLPGWCARCEPRRRDLRSLQPRRGYVGPPRGRHHGSVRGRRSCLPARTSRSRGTPCGGRRALAQYGRPAVHTWRENFAAPARRHSARPTPNVRAWDRSPGRDRRATPGLDLWFQATLIAPLILYPFDTVTDRDAGTVGGLMGE